MGEPIRAPHADVDAVPIPLARLVALRGLALGALALAGLGLLALGALPPADARFTAVALAVVVGVGLLYDVSLAWRGRGLPWWATYPAQVGVDYALLAGAIVALGPFGAPLSALFVWHVAVLAVSRGPRAAFGAALAAGALSLGLVLAGGLRLPPIAGALVGPGLPLAEASHLGALAVSFGGAAWLVSTAVRGIERRERALAEAHDQIALDYEVLTHTLDELEAGLEIVGADGRVAWRNRLAGRLTDWVAVGEAWRCPSPSRPCAVAPPCPVERARLERAVGRCRFAASLDGDERVFEMLSFPLASDAAGPARVMNLYVDRTQTTLAERALVQTERLVSFGRLARSVAHELNTPLATLQTLAADLRGALDALERSAARGVDAEGRAHLDVPTHALDDLRESSDAMHAEARRLGRVTQALLVGRDLLHARLEGPASLAALVERAKAIVEVQLEGEVRVEVAGELEGVVVARDPEGLVQVLVNLLQNARDVTPPEAHVRLAVRREGDTLAIAVEDEGPGLAPDVARRLFEPFVTTKPGEGTGLGLYASRRLVEAMGGTLALEPRGPRGVRAVVRLPAPAREAP